RNAALLCSAPATAREFSARCTPRDLTLALRFPRKVEFPFRLDVALRFCGSVALRLARPALPWVANERWPRKPGPAAERDIPGLPICLPPQCAPPKRAPPPPGRAPPKRAPPKWPPPPPKRAPPPK